MNNVSTISPRLKSLHCPAPLALVHHSGKDASKGARG